jgi:acyl-CoA synthetase (AMP-forming)/AMP-acid ligase II
MTDITPMPPWNSIGRMLSENAALYGDRTAIVDGERQLTYGELHGAARSVAKALIAARVGRGDLVACWAPNGWRWVVMVHAVWLVGGVIVPISSRLKTLEAGPILERTKAAILFTVAECAGTRFIDGLRAAYGDGLEKLPALGHLVRLDLDHAVGADGTGFADFIDTGRAIGDAALDKAIAAVAPDDICEVIFTSGTTGKPKGVQLAHAQLMRSYWEWSGIGSLSTDDNYLVITPFSHGFGLNAGIIASALRGMCMVLLEIFEPATALDLIRRYKVSVVGSSTPMG